jgi:hypothetical protein
VNARTRLFAFSLVFLLQACVGGGQKAPKELLSLNQAQMKIRSFQTRAFDAKDQNKVLRSVVAALQDLGFIVERANGPMGLVTAGKFGPNGRGFVELTVTVRAKGEEQSEVRVNALFNTKPIEDPKVYQNFFSAVERSLFISRG